MEDGKVQGQAHLIVFFISSVVCLLLGIIDLCLPTWFSYCWWDFGLIAAANTSIIKEFSGENTIADVQNDICGDLESLVERSCSSACSNVKNIRSAGLVMLVFGSISLFFMFCSAGIALIRLCKGRVKRMYIGVTIAPFVIWLLGFSSYAGVAGLGIFDSPNNKPEYNFTANSYSIDVGAAIAITIIFLNLGIAAYGWIKIRKLLQVLK